MSEIENLMADFPEQGKAEFEEKAEATAPESPTEPTEADATAPKTEADSAEESSPEAKEEDVKPIRPFHEDPAIQDYLNRQLEKRADKIRDEIEQSISSRFAPKQDEQTIPAWFQRIYGDDKDAWKDYTAYEDSKLQKVKSDTIREYESRQKAEQQKVLDAQKYIDDSLASLEAKGKRFDKNELLKVVNDYRPINEAGNWDFDKAYDILELKKAKSQEKSQARKAIAAASSSDTKAETSTKKDAYTYDEVKKMGWR